MTTSRTALAAAGLLLAPSAVLAQPAAGFDCSRAVSTVELTACAERDLARADRDLNEAYRAALARIDGEAANETHCREWRLALQDAQRKWIAYRDADCRGPVAMRFQGGTGVALSVSVCLLEKTVARTGELKRAGTD